MKNENIKYTTDGRKVVIIGDLNQTEKIVQEIFVTEDGATTYQSEQTKVAGRTKEFEQEPGDLPF